jgi:hypothetical protein
LIGSPVPRYILPWWNDTRAVYIEGATGVFNYGEIQEYPRLQVGDHVNQGEYFGYVITVLRKYKGRHMSMLHLELYDHGHIDTWGEWKIGSPQPEHLKDPTPLLEQNGIGVPTTIDPYDKSAEEYKVRLANEKLQ